LETLAHIEAYMDFPAEDIQPRRKRQLEGRLERAIAFMDELLGTATRADSAAPASGGDCGRPNAGQVQFAQ